MNKLLTHIGKAHRNFYKQKKKLNLQFSHKTIYRYWHFMIYQISRYKQIKPKQR